MAKSQRMTPALFCLYALGAVVIAMILIAATPDEGKDAYLMNAPVALLQRPISRTDRAWIEGLIDARKGADYGDPMPHRYTDPRAVYDRLRAIDDRYPPPPRRASTR